MGGDFEREVAFGHAESGHGDFARQVGLEGAKQRGEPGRSCPDVRREACRFFDRLIALLAGVEFGLELTLLGLLVGEIGCEFPNREFVGGCKVSAGGKQDETGGKAQG